MESSSTPRPGSYSPRSESPVAMVCATAVSLFAMWIVSQAWIAGKIPDWRWAVGALVLIAAPGDARALVRLWMSRRNGGSR